MAKPYKEGAGWAIRLRYKGEDIYLSGFPSAAAASKAAAARQLAIDKIGRPTRLGPERTSLAVAFMDYARERLPFLKGARQDAQRISNYLRASGLPVIKVTEITPYGKGKGVVYHEICFVDEAERVIPNSLKTHRETQATRAIQSEKQRKRLARMKMADVTKHDIQMYINAMKTEGYEPGSLALEQAELRRIFNYARKVWSWPLSVENPASGLDIPKIDNARDRFVTNAEWRKINQALEGYRNPYIVPAIAILLQTAMRSSEPLLQATWGDIDWERCILHLSTAKAGQRDVPLSPDAISSLQTLRAHIQEKARKKAKREARKMRKAQLANVPTSCCPSPDEQIFPTTYEALKKAWNIACVVAKVENAKLHDLRHTAATRYALEFNGNIPVLKVITGHKTDSMLMRYIHINAEHVVAMMHGKQLIHEDAPAGYQGGLGKSQPSALLNAALPSNVVSVDFRKSAA